LHAFRLMLGRPPHIQRKHSAAGSGAPGTSAPKARGGSSSKPGLSRAQVRSNPAHTQPCLSLASGLVLCALALSHHARACKRARSHAHTTYLTRPTRACPSTVKQNLAEYVAMSGLSRPAVDPSAGLVSPTHTLVGVEGAGSGSGSAATVVTEPLEDRRGQGILVTAPAALQAPIQKIQETSSYCGVGVCVCVCVCVCERARACVWRSYTFSLHIHPGSKERVQLLYTYVCVCSRHQQ
jgi:hypothetical protein